MYGSQAGFSRRYLSSTAYTVAISLLYVSHKSLMPDPVSLHCFQSLPPPDTQDEGRAELAMSGRYAQMRVQNGHEQFGPPLDHSCEQTQIAHFAAHLQLPTLFLFFNTVDQALSYDRASPPDTAARTPCVVTFCFVLPEAFATFLPPSLAPACHLGSFTA